MLARITKSGNLGIWESGNLWNFGNFVPGVPRAPGRSLRTGVLFTDLGGLLFVAVIAWLATRWVGVSARFPFTAAGVFVAGVMAAWPLVGGHHPFDRYGPANQITTFRAALVASIVALIFEPATPAAAWAATVMAVIATVLDGVDGTVARRTRLSSAFGARFDVEVDSLLVMALSLLLWQHGRIGAWVLAGGLYRYVFVATGRVLPWMARPLTATKRARLIAACHMLGLTIALAPIIAPAVAAVGVGATLALLSWSFAMDVGRLWRGDTA
jgi:phosphatidylglycerophosphate synthase